MTAPAFDGRRHILATWRVLLRLLLRLLLRARLPIEVEMRRTSG